VRSNFVRLNLGLFEFCLPRHDGLLQRHQMGVMVSIHDLLGNFRSACLWHRLRYMRHIAHEECVLFYQMMLRMQLVGWQWSSGAASLAVLACRLPLPTQPPIGRGLSGLCCLSQGSMKRNARQFGDWLFRESP
jgi:hypothetical protein